MYYAAKSLELLGMFMVAVGFIIHYPRLMDPRLLIAGMICFGSGWAIEKYVLKYNPGAAKVIKKNDFFQLIEFL